MKSNETTFDPEIVFHVDSGRVKWMRDGLRNVKFSCLAHEMKISIIDKTENSFKRRDIIGN